MHQETFYQGNPLLGLPLVATLIFVAIFLGVLAWLYLGRGAKRQFDRVERLPLDDESDRSHQEGASHG